ncbi:MAG: MBL fold metallo-hydrolase [Deltaproteobacteria bacterium]|nr:MBL fold metallo-hydrolase [Deltaproteobacteria bacterium]MBW2394111.1 MBL fold metallo-hydrolase [Deltaproteobacteria bacterium]
MDDTPPPQELDPRTELDLGSVTVLFGAKQGKYPEGNSVLVTGPDETILIDPCLGLIPRQQSLPRVDRLLLSHCHEDHQAAAHLFPDIPIHLHEADLPGIQSVRSFMDLFGFDDYPLIAAGWERVTLDQFHFQPRPEAIPFSDGDVFELGGDVRIEVVHTPGHTRGHSAFHILPADVLFLGDIDLSSFGPYYGDAWADLEDFERSLARVKGIKALHYATFHHVGVVDPATFEERLGRFTAKIEERDSRLLAYLAEPHTMEEVVQHRFIYRPGDAVDFADPVELRSMSQHLDRLMRRGRIAEIQPGVFQSNGV